jgi:hypothetical protein
MTFELTTADVPQEDSLQTVRLVLQSIAEGLQDTESMAARSGVSRRHAGYAINALIVLGLISEGDEALAPSDDAKKLLATGAGSADEKAAFRGAVERSPAMRAIAPDLLAAQGPERDTLRDRIMAAAGLSKSTSDRRAQALLSWRRQLVG